MKSAAAFAVPVQTLPAAQPAKTSRPAATAPARRKAVARTVPIRMMAPAAKTVFVAGSFNQWQAGVIPLRAGQNGEWVGEIDLTPGRYEYLLIVDGNWQPDPAAAEVALNPFGGCNSVLSVN